MNCLAIVCFVLELGARVGAVDNTGDTALLVCACCGRYSTMQFMLKEEGANVEDVNIIGENIWDKLIEHFGGLEVYNKVETDTAAMISLLRVMVLRGALLDALVAQLSPEPARVVRGGAQLRARFPAHLVRPRALLDVHCPVLLPPLRALVHGYTELTTTEEIWATRVGACIYVYLS
jgi:hypothetical protein